MYHDATVLVMLTISAPDIADQKPATTKSSSIAATRPNIAALRTSRKSPNDRIVIGKVSRKATGLTTALTRPRRIAASNKLPVPEIVTPGRMLDANTSPSIVTNIRITNPGMFQL